MAHTIFVKGGSKMPVLNCSAMGCAYNVDHLCNKGTIQVDGSVAQKTDETCCASFRERSGGSASNNGGCGCSAIDIQCEAQGCSYNSQCRCHADSVSISGKNACSCDDTRCSTFRCK